MSSDEAIQLTNTDATSFKSYAVEQGYWADPFIGYFASNPAANKLEHKAPEMSRGYFARVHAIRSVVENFLAQHNATRKSLPSSAASSRCQIVSLGAGYDTLFFNLHKQNTVPVRYVEVDYDRVVASKSRIIKSKRKLAQAVGLMTNDSDGETAHAKLSQFAPSADSFRAMHIGISPPQQSASTTTTPEPHPNRSFESKTEVFKLPSPQHTGGAAAAPLFGIKPACPSSHEIHTSNYHLVGVDLRNLVELNRKLDECELDRSLPTLFIAECVLVYMSAESSASLLDFLARSFTHACFVNYEPVNMNDKFAEIMLHNMANRATRLLGVEPCHSIVSQIERFVKSGFAVCQVITMTDYYTNKLERHERERIERIEFLDEGELLMQLMDHYCVCIAANEESMKNVFFK